MDVLRSRPSVGMAMLTMVRSKTVIAVPRMTTIARRRISRSKAGAVAWSCSAGLAGRFRVPGWGRVPSRARNRRPSLASFWLGLAVQGRIDADVIGKVAPDECAEARPAELVRRDAGRDGVPPGRR